MGIKCEHIGNNPKKKSSPLPKTQKKNKIKLGPLGCMLSLFIIDHMKIMVLSLNYYLSPFLA
jgi:hypothetical protein